MGPDDPLRADAPLTMSSISPIDTDSVPHEPKCAAHALSPTERQEIAVAALAEEGSVSELSRQHKVSRKFVAHQRDKATDAQRAGGSSFASR